MEKKKRYALVGLGSRSMMYVKALVEDFGESCELVALCDMNEGRVQLRADWMRKHDKDVLTYTSDQFDQMLTETRPDVVLVLTKDCAHDDYICRAMEAGCDTVTEKPMTTDEKKCQRILDTQKRTGRSCTVTFNYRYAPPRTQLKDLLMSGIIGNVLSVDFHWLLDTKHGADYFRRWHRNKVNSGGLMVHKATHHFDLVNWWLSTVPETVYASGSRKFYTPETAKRYGLHQRGERCHGCREAAKCPFFLDLTEFPKLKRQYLDQEEYDGYFRDRCVFSPDIDIEDNMQLVVDYRSGATMSYSLHSFMPWEGYMVSFNGSKGCLEHVCQESAYFSGDGSVPGELQLEGTQTKIYPAFQGGYDVEIWEAHGGHGGGDPLLLRDIFAPEGSEDTYLQAADYRAGAWSVLTGIAANHSIETGKAISIQNLISGLSEPDYPPMPSPNESLPLPTGERSVPEWFKE